jgi:hypothetical protein
LTRDSNARITWAQFFRHKIFDAPSETGNFLNLGKALAHLVLERSRAVEKEFRKTKKDATDGSPDL